MTHNERLTRAWKTWKGWMEWKPQNDPDPFWAINRYRDALLKLGGKTAQELGRAPQ